jgi:PilZ domain
MATRFDEPNWKEPHNKRKASRNDVRIIADLMVSAGPRFKVAVMDLSQTGFRMQTGNYISRDSKVYLTMPGFQGLKARIAWNDRDWYGCEFAQPLHPSIFDHIAREHPSLVR